MSGLLIKADFSYLALLLGLRFLPLPTFLSSKLELLTRALYSCRGILVLYFSLVLFFSEIPSSASALIRDPAHPPLWEILCSAMLTVGRDVLKGSSGSLVWFVWH